MIPIYYTKDINNNHHHRCCWCNICNSLHRDHVTNGPNYIKQRKAAIDIACYDYDELCWTHKRSHFMARSWSLTGRTDHSNRSGWWRMDNQYHRNYCDDGRWKVVSSGSSCPSFEHFLRLPEKEAIDQSVDAVKQVQVEPKRRNWKGTASNIMISIPITIIRTL